MHTNTTIDVPAVKDLSRIAAEANPNRLAFGEAASDRRLAWSDYEERSNRAAMAFQEYVAQGDRVAFLCEGSIDHVTLWNGALKAGTVVSNLHIRASPSTTAYCIDNLRPRVLVIDSEEAQRFEESVQEKLETDCAAIVTIGETDLPEAQSLSSFLAGQPPTEPDVRVREDDLAAVFWTSGTTGDPKGWCFTNRALLIKAWKLAGSVGGSRTKRSITSVTPSFAAWWSNVLPRLLAGSTTFILRDWDPERLARLIEEEDITNAGLVTTMWREVLRLDDFEEYDFSSLDGIGSTGEKLDSTTLHRLEEHICKNVSNGYGATEVLCTSISNDEMEGDRVESVGKPTMGTRVRVVEEGGPPDSEKAPGELGEIIVKGADAAVWAWGDTATTEEEFKEGWWYSGDLGYKDEDGYLYLEGRKDFMITTKGMKVFPVPVEERLNSHPGVEEAAVVGVADEEYGEMVTAVVNRADPDVTATDLDEWCRKSDDLAGYERPREYTFIDEELPRTASGKLDRQTAQTAVR